MNVFISMWALFEDFIAHEIDVPKLLNHMLSLPVVQAYIKRLLTSLYACSGSNRDSVEPAMLEVGVACILCTSNCYAMSCTLPCIYCQHTLPACSPAWAASKSQKVNFTCAVRYATLSAGMSASTLLSSCCCLHDTSVLLHTIAQNSHCILNHTPACKVHQCSKCFATEWHCWSAYCTPDAVL